MFSFDYAEARHGLLFTARSRNVRITAPANATEQSMSHLMAATREWCRAHSIPADNIRLSIPTRTVALDLPEVGNTDTVMAMAQFMADRLDAGEQGRERRNTRHAADEDEDEAPLRAPTG